MRTAPLLALLLLAPLAAFAQADTLYVGVQRPDGEPVVGATVQLGERGASTDAEGLTAFEDVAPGEHTVRVSFVGSLPVELEIELTAPGPWALAVNLEDATGLLGGVVVEGKQLERSRMARDGFFRRQQSGFGTVLDAEDLARRNPIVLSDALRGSVPGVLVQPGAFGTGVVSTRGRCRMGVYLDGFFSPSLTEDLDTVPAQDVVAIEVYRGAQVPIQYQTIGRAGAACGVVLVWTTFSTTNPR
ncbi:carboxypeptidase regulatory-like domain-containing protein [Rubrivirga sp. S365]|uniref:TonB-dependent receptor plug domain-containing protein n=1 Tax=Rubrivirga sp. S365 TaxID=3076080 RepID=UPI0028C9CDB5|nr:carboxypeptidase regulatory-like domain-containing protein [Rubrivirga sp. S365]MDT7855385.1 carboxypeptidase regulatory-like domain-containing protein [Rubrivirga sp. S365]